MLVVKQRHISDLNSGTTVQSPCADPEGGGGQGYRSPLENHKNIVFLKITKLQGQCTIWGII